MSKIITHIPDATLMALGMDIHFLEAMQLKSGEKRIIIKLFLFPRCREWPRRTKVDHPGRHTHKRLGKGNN